MCHLEGGWPGIFESVDRGLSCKEASCEEPCKAEVAGAMTAEAQAYHLHSALHPNLLKIC